jgi:hypothetical protein
VGSGTQLATLPWSDIDQIKVVFSDDVIIDQGDLKLAGVNLTTYDVAGGTFSYDSATYTATWTLPQAIDTDKLLLRLNADGANPITDQNGDHLDGEWTNPISTSDTGTSTYPSGDGTAGGDFLFRFNVLPGDSNQDGITDFADLGTVIGNYNQVGDWTTGDFTGDGQVDFSDLGVVIAYYNQSLPASDPVAPGSMASSGRKAEGDSPILPSEKSGQSSGDSVLAVTKGDNPILPPSPPAPLPLAGEGSFGTASQGDRVQGDSPILPTAKLEEAKGNSPILPPSPPAPLPLASEGSTPYHPALDGLEESMDAVARLVLARRLLASLPPSLPAPLPLAGEGSMQSPSASIAIMGEGGDINGNSRLDQNVPAISEKSHSAAKEDRSADVLGRIFSEMPTARLFDDESYPAVSGVSGGTDMMTRGVGGESEGLGAGLEATGSFSVKAVPLPTVLSTRIRP